jgi:tetratricopeptide (TPR) repeat protein
MRFLIFTFLCWAGLCEIGSSQISLAQSTPLKRFEEQLYIGTQYLEVGDLIAAVEHLSASIKEKSNEGEPYFERGRAYSQLGYFEKAISDFDTAIKLKCQLSRSYENKGYCHLQLNQIKQGIDDCSAAIKVDNRARNAYENRAKGYAQLKEIALSRADSDKVAELDSEDAALVKKATFKPSSGRSGLLGQVLIGTAAKRQAQLQGRVTTYEAAVKRNPKSANAWYELGVIQANLESLPEAVKSFGTAISLDPKRMDAHLSRAAAYTRMNDFGDAEKDLVQVNKALPEDVKARLLLGLCNVGKKQYSQAVAWYTSAIKIVRSDSTSAVLEKSDQANRLKCFESLAKAFGSRSSCYSLLNDNAKALIDINQAVEYAKSNFGLQSDLRFRRAKILYGAGKYEQAIDDLSELIKRNPADAEMYFRRAESYAAIKNYKSAVNDLSKVLELEGPNGKIYRYRSGLYEKLGQKDLMEADAQRAAKMEQKTGASESAKPSGSRPQSIPAAPAQNSAPK